jgi:hypothetical protein
MTKNFKKLETFDGESLMDERIEPLEFCIDTLLPQGLIILAGPPKVGKSWLVLDWCLSISKGEKVWDFNTKQGTTLYLCLEDTKRRLQNRLNVITDDVPNNIFFATSSCSLADGLEEQIEDFVTEHSDTKLVVIDTLQLVRKVNKDISYANDYDEISKLKHLADELNISLLLIHHFRKESSGDFLNNFSGSTAITGCADTLISISDKERGQNRAVMQCSGRDVEERKIEIEFSKETHRWNIVSDSFENPEILLPEDVFAVIELMKKETLFVGSNTELTEKFNTISKKQYTPNAFKRMLNFYRFQLEDYNVFFNSYRSSGKRYITIRYECSADSDDYDDKNLVP